MMAVAGPRHALLSPMAATPAGRASTPLPTHALMRLKADAEREDLPDEASFDAEAVALAAPPRKVLAGAAGAAGRPPLPIAPLDRGTDRPSAIPKDAMASARRRRGERERMAACLLLWRYQ